jgi:cytochrome c oxidase subunit 1
VTLLEERPAAGVPAPHERRATGILAFCTTTDHKRIGIAYMVTAFIFFLIGGAMAEVIRAQLIQPEQDLISEDTYNQLFTMHGTIMLLLFVSPFAIGLANYLVPLMIGASDVAFPRLNALGYWLTLFAGVVMLGGFATADGAAKFGWYAYAPLTSDVRTPGLGGDLWIVGIALLGASGVITAVNIVATVSTMRAPGMTFFRMPIFVWNFFVVSLLILMTFPVLTAAGAMLFLDRHFDFHVFDAAFGGVPVLWQHLFWWFGHPEVYILILPFFGVFTEIFPVFSRRPVFGYIGLCFATLAIGLLSLGVWAHHMFTTGVVVLSFFSVSTMLIAVPTGVKFFNWIATMWGGKLRFNIALVWGIGFLLTFLIGGLTGPMLASAPLDFHLSDSYFVVAHFHYVLFGGSVFGIFAAVYYWFPKFTGRMLNERLGALHFALTFIGMHLTFLVQHIVGLEGMPRRVQSYLEADGFDTWNLISSIGAFLLGISVLPFLWNVWRSLRKGEPAGDNPWDGQTLEWWTSSPPPPENFDRPLPPIRSERPVWDYNHPDAVARH